MDIENEKDHSCGGMIMKFIEGFLKAKDNSNSTSQVTLNKEYLEKHLFFGSLPEFQLKPLEAIINEYSRRNVTNLSILAYTMATAYHETARFKYKEEIGKGKGRDYGGLHLVIRGHKERYHGRGWTQLTWLQNYVEMSIKCSRAFNEEIDLVSNPDRVFEEGRINSFIICEGMLTGSFTGKKITDYISDVKTDFKNSRRVINGTDDAQLIAGYASQFLEALNEK